MLGINKFVPEPLKPFLKPIYAWYLPNEREFQFCGVRAKFHQHSFSSFFELNRIKDEKLVVEKFLSEISSEDIVWDIGANLGVYSCFAAKMGAQVISFEPTPRTVSKLRRNIELNNVSADIHPIALSNKNVSRELVLEYNHGLNSLEQDGDELIEI